MLTKHGTLEKLTGSTLTFALVVAWLDGEPRILANATTFSLPSTLTIGHEPRAAAPSHVSALFRSARPNDTPPVSFLVDDLQWCRLVAVPLKHLPSQYDFGPLAWLTLSDLGETPLRLPAYRAFSTIAALLGDDARPQFPPPSLPGGARAARFVPQAPPVLATNSALWPKQLADARRSNGVLRHLLLSDDSADSEYFHEWAEQIRDVPHGAVPPNLRGAEDGFADMKYASTPFAYRDTVPLTAPAPTPAEQRSAYRPRSITPDIFPQDVADDWALWWPKVIADLRSYAADPGSPRTFNTPFIIPQSRLHPSARGVFWDLRNRDADGAYLPLQFHSPLDTHLGVQFLLDEWQDYPDQEMVYMIAVTGVDFKVSFAAGQTVIYPHLESISAGYASVEKELLRLNGLGFNEFFASFPFVPWCALPNGATARRLEDRMRRTTECGAPRNFLADSSNDEVVPLNRRIGAKDIVPDAATRYQFPRLPTTTGHLTYSSAAHAHAISKPYKDTRWPKEVKPRVEDFLHDLCVLKHAASQLGEDVFVFTADAKDYFNQLKLAPWCWPHVGLLWTSLGDARSDYTCVAEYSLGFGFSCASNIAQRLSYGILGIFRRHFDLEDSPYLDADRRKAPRYFQSRDAVSALTGHNEPRLAAAHMYTDDPIFVVVGAERAKRLLAVWRSVTSQINLTMAIAAKHQGGVTADWLGLTQLASLAGMHTGAAGVGAGARTLLTLKWMTPKTPASRSTLSGSTPEGGAGCECGCPPHPAAHIYDITITHILISDRNIFSKQKYVSTSPSPGAHFGERNLCLSRIRRSNRIKSQVPQFFVQQKGMYGAPLLHLVPPLRGCGSPLNADAGAPVAPKTLRGAAAAGDSHVGAPPPPHPYASLFPRRVSRSFAQAHHSNL